MDAVYENTLKREYACQPLMLSGVVISVPIDADNPCVSYGFVNL